MSLSLNDAPSRAPQAGPLNEESVLRMRLVSSVLLLLLIAPLAGADIRASLPLLGYSKPGYFIPVRLVGVTTANEIEISGNRAAPTRIAAFGGSVDVVVPLLALGSPDDIAIREFDGRKPIPIQPASRDMHDRILSPSRVLIGNTTGQPMNHIIAVGVDVPLDPVDPVPGPALAWEALDYLVVEPATTARIGEAKLLELVATGMTILHLGPRPSSTLPWASASNIIPGRTDVWRLYAEVRGFRGSVFEHALVPVAGMKAGLSDASRRHVLLAGVLFAVVVTGIALLLSPRRPIVLLAVMVVTVVLTVAALRAWWARQPARATGGGWVVVEQPPFTQIDSWIYAAPRPGETWNLPGTLRPVAESIDALARLRPTLRCGADGDPVGFSCTGSGSYLAVVARDVMLGGPPTAAVDPTVTSPLLPMVRRGYIEPRLRRVAIIGQAPSDAWPTVVIRTVDPASRAATRPWAK